MGLIDDSSSRLCFSLHYTSLQKADCGPAILWLGSVAAGGHYLSSRSTEGHCFCPMLTGGHFLSDGNWRLLPLSNCNWRSLLSSGSWRSVSVQWQLGVSFCPWQLEITVQWQLKVTVSVQWQWEVTISVPFLPSVSIWEVRNQEKSWIKW